MNEPGDSKHKSHLTIIRPKKDKKEFPIKAAKRVWVYIQ
jgi:hypothetical protein